MGRKGIALLVNRESIASIMGQKFDPEYCVKEANEYINCLATVKSGTGNVACAVSVTSDCANA